jgi:hypothetical protein
VQLVMVSFSAWVTRGRLASIIAARNLPAHGQPALCAAAAHQTWKRPFYNAGAQGRRYVWPIGHPRSVAK